MTWIRVIAWLHGVDSALVCLEGNFELLACVDIRSLGSGAELKMEKRIYVKRISQEGELCQVNVGS